MALGPDISLQDAQAIVETKTAPRITVESITARIAATRYLTDGTMTICIIEMRNGFKSLGKSAPASPANYDRQVGIRYAYEDAFRHLWALEAYVLLTDMERGRVNQDLPVGRSAEL